MNSILSLLVFVCGFSHADRASKIWVGLEETERKGSFTYAPDEKFDRKAFDRAMGEEQYDALMGTHLLVSGSANQLRTATVFNFIAASDEGRVVSPDGGFSIPYRIRVGRVYVGPERSESTPSELSFVDWTLYRGRTCVGRYRLEPEDIGFLRDESGAMNLLLSEQTRSRILARLGFPKFWLGPLSSTFKFIEAEKVELAGRALSLSSGVTTDLLGIGVVNRIGRASARCQVWLNSPSS